MNSDRDRERQPERGGGTGAAPVSFSILRFTAVWIKNTYLALSSCAFGLKMLDTMDLAEIMALEKERSKSEYMYMYIASRKWISRYVRQDVRKNAKERSKKKTKLEEIARKVDEGISVGKMSVYMLTAGARDTTTAEHILDDLLYMPLT